MRRVLVIILLVAISYINSLSADFIWDDYALLVTNNDVKSGNLGSIFRPAHKDTTSRFYKTPTYFRPLQIFSYILDYRIWKLNPFGYHLTNIILHTINAVILLFILIFLFKDAFMALLMAALFAVNPVFSSAVTYISARADILLGLFSFLSVFCFIRYLQDKKAILYCLSLLYFICALLSKEIGVFVILFIFIVNRFIYNRKKYLIYAPYLVILPIYYYFKPPALISNWRIIGIENHNIIFDILTLLKGLCVYTSIAIFPFNLHMGRSITMVNSISDIWVYLSVLFLIALICLFIVLSRKDKLILSGLAWFYLPILAALLFNNFFARRQNEILLPEHNLYFSYAGLLVVFSALLSKLRQKKKVWVALICVVASQAIFSISENFRWQDEVRFYETNLRRAKNSVFDYLVYANLGYAYERQKDYLGAEGAFRKAAELARPDPYFYNILAEFHIRNKAFDQAIETLEQSRSLDDRFYPTYLLLGVAYIGKGDTKEARSNFQQVLTLDPQNHPARHCLNKLQ